MSSLSGIGGRLYRGETSIDFIGKRRRWYAISALLILASIGALAIQGLHLGIEFKGGSSYIVTKQGVTVEDARAAVESTGITSETIIQKIGTEKVRVQTGALSTVESNQLQDALASKLGVSVGSIVKKLLARPFMDLLAL